MTRRWVARGAVTAMLAASLTAFGLAQPAVACACGAPAPPPGMEVTVGQEHSLVTWADGVERIDMVLGVLADGAETGLIVPTPTPATVSLGDRALFEALDRQIAPVVETEYRWWGGLLDGAGAGAPPTVLSEVDLGPVQAVTLAADDADGLRAWLDENGYGIAPAVQALLDDYVARGWSFAALKLTGEEPLEGGLDPIRFEFATDAPVYPLLLSQAASVPQDVRLYLFGDGLVDVTLPDGGRLPGYVSWAGEVDEPELLPLGAYLTVYEAYFYEPGEQITGDLDLRFTAEREDFQPVTVRTEYLQLLGVPLGFVFVGIGVGIVVLVWATLEGRRRRTAR